jgi:ABC-type glycerol-3-phosphate transport system substrate-binding protein
MIDQQGQFFKEKIVAGFVDKNNSDIEVITYNNVDSIDFELDKFVNEIGLVKVPFEKSWSLVRKDYIMPLDSFLNEDELNEFNKTFILTSLGNSKNKQYFIPRKFETRLMVYLQSKVVDAVSIWRKYRNEIQEDLKKFNGTGLPATYILESDPNEWNYFDIFVVGWIWAHTPYNGRISARIAHRGKKYSGTSHRVIDRVFQCNGDSADVINLQGDAVIDAFHWEAVYAASGIYNEKMWKESWSGSGVWKGFQDGEVFLSFMTQLDCFFIHGTGHKGLKGYLTNPDDFGVATMPMGCSVELSSTGKIKRVGRKAITTGGWWWGIPKTTPDPHLSYKFARHIISMENQVQGCSRFGMIPVRKDVLIDMQMLFGGEWISEIYNVSFKQLMYNKTTIVPSHPRFNEIGHIYLDAWFDIVVGKNWSDNKSIPDRIFIQRYINEKYVPKINNINY